MNRQRTKKITVACNFCRCALSFIIHIKHLLTILLLLLFSARKLKCDGGRPTCGQCLKRSNPCDYMPQNKRRGTQRPRKGGAGGDESGSESGEDRSPDGDEPSLSPDMPSQPMSRRSSNVGRGQQQHEGYPPSLPSMSAISDRERERREESSVASSSRPKLDPGSSSGMQSSRGGYFADNDVPHIATLPLTEPSPPTPAPMSAPTLPPIRPASELQAAQRKRASTMPGKSTRQTTTSGPKVVACNFCRGRLYCRYSCYPLCLQLFYF
jgi:hypothetical protein